MRRKVAICFPRQLKGDSLRLAFYQPDIPQNLGAAIRLGACFAAPVDIIQPCGFALTGKALARAAMDYGALADVTAHDDWTAFHRQRQADNVRLILFSTAATIGVDRFEFRQDDCLLFGQESVGVPDAVSAACDHGVRIPMARGARSLNVAMSAGIALYEALRQTGGLVHE